MFNFENSYDRFTINKMHTITTTEDNQDRVIIRVFSGMGNLTRENLLQGGIEFAGIAPAPKGVPRIRVRISSHACGYYINLNVMDVASGRINATIFSPNHGLYEFFDKGEIENGDGKFKYSMKSIELMGLPGGTFELEPVDE